MEIGHRVYSVQFIILLNRVHIAFSIDTVNINFVIMVGREDFIVSNIL